MMKIDPKEAWLFVIKQAKVYGVAVAAAGISVWGIAEYYLEDYVKETVEKVIEEKHGNKSFREVLGEKMEIPEDEVPIRLVEKFTALDSLIVHVAQFEEKHVPYLDFQLSISPMYRYLDESGVEWWMGPDRRPHGVLYDENGTAWCVYSNAKREL